MRAKGSRRLCERDGGGAKSGEGREKTLRDAVGAGLLP